MDMEIEQKDIRIHFLKDKIGIPEFKIMEEMNRLELKKYHVKKNDRTMNRLNKMLTNHKHIKY